MFKPPCFFKLVRQRQISYDTTYMWNLIKNDTNELIYKTERLMDLKIKFMVTKGETWGEVIN